MPATGAGTYPPLVAFDLDGTLLRGTSVAMHLADRLGLRGALDDLERAFVAGEISSRRIADASAAQYAGRSTAELAGHLRDAAWIGGIDETVAALRADGTRVVLATITWRFAAEVLQQRHGFDAVSGTEIEVGDGRVGGRVRRYFEEQDKVDFVVGACAALGLPPDRAAAVGDSRSDLPLFARVGRSVALNATPEAQAAATHVLDSDDLRDVLPLLRVAD